jgi:hypothetical protein
MWEEIYKLSEIKGTVNGFQKFVLLWFRKKSNTKILSHYIKIGTNSKSISSTYCTLAARKGNFLTMKTLAESYRFNIIAKN